MYNGAELAIAVLREHGVQDARIGLVLGSGLGPLGHAVADPVRLPYSALPGFPQVKVSSHDGDLIAGRLCDVPVIVLSGRAHYYETGDPRAMRIPLATLKAMGCEAVLLTSAAGSLREDMAPGSLMAVTDHIAFSGKNPLIRESGDARFVDMSAAYDPDLCRRLFDAATDNGIALRRGVYTWFSGPSFETPAEIRAARSLGADAVGMSVVPETILARYIGLRVAAISVITNFAAGIGREPLSHEGTKKASLAAGDPTMRLIEAFLERF